MSAERPPSAAAATSYLVFAACSPGLESLLQAEALELGLTSKLLPGGIELRGGAPALWTLCRQSRLTESARVRLKSFVARDFDALTSELRRLPWRAYIPTGASPTLRVTCHKSRLWHSDAVAERVLGVLGERIAVAQPGECGPALTIYVRLQRDRVQVSIDAGGGRLHRRGYRTHVAEASLRETLAAALVRVAAQEEPKARVLWDPFCGAGTIGLEWLETGLGRAPGARRRFAFEDWPTHDAVAYRSWVTARRDVERARAAAAPTLRVVGSDLSPRILRAARANAASADLEAHCEWIAGDFEQVEPQIPEGALIVTNPPYGVRLRQVDRRGSVLERLARLLTRRRDLRPVVLLLPRGARAALPAELERVAETSNGGLAVGVWRWGEQ